jgi:hypothetical protein
MFFIIIVVPFIKSLGAAKRKSRCAGTVAWRGGATGVAERNLGLSHFSFGNQTSLSFLELGGLTGSGVTASGKNGKGGRGGK